MGTFRQGATDNRNARDRAMEQRGEAIRRAIERMCELQLRTIDKSFRN